MVWGTHRYIYYEILWVGTLFSDKPSGMQCRTAKDPQGLPFFNIFSVIFPGRSKGTVHVFTVCIRTENQNQASFSPFGPHEVSVLIELTLGHLRYHWTDVPPQPNSPPDYVFRANQMHSQLYKRFFLVKWLYTFGYGSNLSTSSSGWLSPRLLQFGGFIDTIWHIIRYITIHHNTISLPFLNIQTQRLRRNWDGASLGSQVDSSALGMLRTELHVLPVSPVQLFRNLYIDLSWYPLQGEGRHLQESCGDLSWKITGQTWGLQ